MFRRRCRSSRSAKTAVKPRMKRLQANPKVIQAVRHGNVTELVSTVDAVLAKSCEVDPCFVTSGINGSGKAALHYAIESGNVVVAAKLVALGANINQGTSQGWTPVHLAAWSGHVRCLDLLLTHNALTTSVITGGSWKGYDAVGLAAYRGHVEIAERLARIRSSTTTKNATEADGNVIDAVGLAIANSRWRSRFTCGVRGRATVEAVEFLNVRSAAARRIQQWWRRIHKELVAKRTVPVVTIQAWYRGCRTRKWFRPVLATYRQSVERTDLFEHLKTLCASDNALDRVQASLRDAIAAGVFPNCIPPSAHPSCCSGDACIDAHKPEHVRSLSSPASMTATTAPPPPAPPLPPQQNKPEHYHTKFYTKCCDVLIPVRSAPSMTAPVVGAIDGKTEETIVQGFFPDETRSSNPEEGLLEDWLRITNPEHMYGSGNAWILRRHGINYNVRLKPHVDYTCMSAGSWKRSGLDIPNYEGGLGADQCGHYFSAGKDNCFFCGMHRSTITGAKPHASATQAQARTGYVDLIDVQKKCMRQPLTVWAEELLLSAHAAGALATLRVLLESGVASPIKPLLRPVGSEDKNDKQHRRSEVTLSLLQSAAMMNDCVVVDMIRHCCESAFWKAMDGHPSSLVHEQHPHSLVDRRTVVTRSVSGVTAMMKLFIDDTTCSSNTTTTSSNPILAALLPTTTTTSTPSSSQHPACADGEVPPICHVQGTRLSSWHPLVLSSAHGSADVTRYLLDCVRCLGNESCTDGPTAICDAEDGVLADSRVLDAVVYGCTMHIDAMLSVLMEVPSVPLFGGARIASVARDTHLPSPLPCALRLMLTNDGCRGADMERVVDAFINELGCDVDCAGPDGTTALMVAARAWQGNENLVPEHDALVDALCERGACLLRQDRDGKTVWNHAAAAGNMAAMRSLMRVAHERVQRVSNANALIACGDDARYHTHLFGLVPFPGAMTLDKSALSDALTFTETHGRCGTLNFLIPLAPNLLTKAADVVAVHDHLMRLNLKEQGMRLLLVACEASLQRLGSLLAQQPRLVQSKTDKPLWKSFTHECSVLSKVFMCVHTYVTTHDESGDITKSNATNAPATSAIVSIESLSQESDNEDNVDNNDASDHGDSEANAVRAIAAHILALARLPVVLRGLEVEVFTGKHTKDSGDSLTHGVPWCSEDHARLYLEHLRAHNGRVPSQMAATLATKLNADLVAEYAAELVDGIAEHALVNDTGGVKGAKPAETVFNKRRHGNVTMTKTATSKEGTVVAAPHDEALRKVVSKNKAALNAFTGMVERLETSPTAHERALACIAPWIDLDVIKESQQRKGDTPARKSASHFLAACFPDHAVTCGVCLAPMIDPVEVGRETGGEHFRKGVCGHEFCSECLVSWIDTNLASSASVIHCPDSECNCVMHADDVQRIGGHQRFTKFKEITSRSYKDRLVDFKDEAMSAWVKKNTRVCPHCSIIVERSAGCNNMLCTCGQRFNWNTAATVEGTF